MNRFPAIPNTVTALIRPLSGMAGLAVLFVLVLTLPAYANFEQVATFGGSNTSLAVNFTGAGGVPANTVYAGGQGVIRYGPKGELLGAWGEGSFNSLGIAVDQETGDVYVLTGNQLGPSIRVFSADGSHEIAGFSERAAFNESVDESPEKLHLSFESGIAVDDKGTVYVSDRGQGGDPASRVMVFRPQSPSDYEHYVYEGRENDLASSFEPRQLALDASGNLFAANLEAIYEFAPGSPAAPVCHYRVPGSGLNGMTVDDMHNLVYYYNYKYHGQISMLSGCNAKGELGEAGVVATITGKLGSQETIRAMAIDPNFSYESSRPAGVLYAGEYILAAPVIRAPVVNSESVGSVGSSTASLAGEVNPNGSATRYVFQYIDEAAYQVNAPTDRFAGAATAPVGGGSAGGGSDEVTLRATLSGLSPDTAYRFRLVAISHCNPANETDACEGSGSVMAFRTYPVEASGLADERVYELVSPPVKNGGEVFPLAPFYGSCEECKPGSNISPFPMQSALDGESVVYRGFPFSSTGEGAAKVDEYVSKRTDTGWQTTVLSAPLLTGEFLGVTADLSKLVFSQGASAVLNPEAPGGYPDLYEQSAVNWNSFVPLLTSEPPDREGGTTNLRFAGGSSDYSRLFFSANDALTAETPVAPGAVDGGPGKSNLYEWQGGQLRLVNVLPGNASTAPGAVFGSGTNLDSTGELPQLESDFSHAISDDGSHVFWSDETGQVYVRVNGEATIAIPDGGRFLTASTDGTQVLLSNGHMYGLVSKEEVDLTGGLGGFQGILGQSDDLSHVYFVDTAALTGTEANEYGASAQAGQNNLYSWQSGTTRFIAALGIKENVSDWVAAPQDRTAEVSADGRWLTFESNKSLTGYDNTPAPEAPGTELCGRGTACTEVFLYGAGSGKLTCASCNPAGIRPLGPSRVPFIESANNAFGQPHYLTDGGRVYFDSQDSLSQFDTNGGVEDVYEYEPSGVGSCGREQGCVTLISSGRGSDDSDFFAADETGKNVFFTTRDRLVPGDHDELLDVYDAREGGGISEQGRSGECDGEACQASTVAPSDPVLSSAGFEGPGDLAPLLFSKAKPKSLTSKQRLLSALKVCQRKPKRKRVRCRHAAQRHYGGRAAARKTIKDRRAR